MTIGILLCALVVVMSAAVVGITAFIRANDADERATGEIEIEDPEPQAPSGAPFFGVLPTTKPKPHLLQCNARPGPRSCARAARTLRSEARPKCSGTC